MLYVHFMSYQQYKNVHPVNVDKYFELSDKQNIIILSFDGIYGVMVDELLAQHPEIKKELDGFVRYTDVASVAPATSWSHYSSIVGKVPPLGAQGMAIHKLPQIDRDYNILSIASKQGFDIKTLNVNGQYSKNASKANIEQIFRNSFPSKTQSILSLGTVRWLPDMFFSYIKVKRYDVLKTWIFDFQVFKMFSDDMSMHKTAPVLIYYHYDFSHEPVVFNKDCQAIAHLPQNYRSGLEETECVFKQITHWIRMLKRIGAYNNSTIILMSDHGRARPYTLPYNVFHNNVFFGSFLPENADSWWSLSRYVPILLVKKMQSKGSLKYNADPVSLVDLPVTLCNVILSQNICATFGYEGYNIFKNIPFQRERSIIAYQVPLKMRTHNWLSESRLTTFGYHRYDFTGNARISIPQLFDPMKVVPLNQELSIANPPHQLLRLKGFSVSEQMGRWTDGNNAYIAFWVGSQNIRAHELLLDVRPYTPKGHRIDVHFKINGIEVAHEKFKNQKRHHVHMILPKDVLKINAPNLLEIKIDHPISPKSLGLSNDKIMLGLFVQKWVLQG